MASLINRCYVCGKGFSHFKCKICEKHFFRNTDLILHMTMHGDVKKETYKCDLCDKEHSQKESLEKHMIVDHIYETNIKCSFCGKWFYRQSELTSHLEVYHHQDVKNLKCESCWKEYFLEESSEEGRFHHPPVKGFKCSICRKEFNQKSNFIAHMGIHVGVNDFKCKHCEKKCYSHAELKRHVSISRGMKGYKCRVCNEKFPYKFCLVEHRALHTDCDFKCEICGSDFSKKASLVRHTAIHTGIRDYKCDECGDEFALKSDLRKHSKTHLANPVEGIQQINAPLVLNDCKSAGLTNSSDAGAYPVKTEKPIVIECDSIDVITGDIDGYSELKFIDAAEFKESDSFHRTCSVDFSGQEMFIIKEEEYEIDKSV